MLSNFQKPPRYLFKLDDDSYVNLLPLSKMLKQLERRSPEGDFLLGRTLGRDPKPIQISEKARGKKFTDKWACPSYMFSGGHYPPTLSGAGYAMTLGAARCLYQKLLLLPFFHLEDVFVTGFGAQECSGLPVITTNRFWNVPSTLKHMDTRNDVLFHYKDSDAKRLIFKACIFCLQNVARFSQFPPPCRCFSSIVWCRNTTLPWEIRAKAA